MFGKRLRDAGLLGSMGRVASSVDNCMMESFFSALQCELLDPQRWPSRAELGSAIGERVRPGTTREPARELGHLSPVEFEHPHHDHKPSHRYRTSGMIITTPPRVRETGSGSGSCRVSV